MTMSSTASRSIHAPADVRLANLARIVHELRSAGSLSRTDVARRAGISLPTAHRLISDLADLRVVEEDTPASDGTRLGRPPAVYRFRDDAALLAGMDVGNETTRLAITTLTGRVIASQAVTSGQLSRNLADAVAARIGDMVTSTGHVPGQLAGAAVGIAAAVDADGVLRAPPIHTEWAGLPLRDELRARLGCAVTVAQDDHLSPLAESSDAGTFPGAGALLVLEIGRGIGVGMTLDGIPIPGAHHRFGRIAGWPVPVPAGPGTGTLGECLVTSGLVDQYHQRGGPGDIRDGAALAAAARRGDERALAVFDWAATQIADVINRLQQLADPQAVVIGGGLARAYDLLEPRMTPQLMSGAKVARSVLGEQAVVVGAVLVAGSFVDSWLDTLLARA